MKRKLVKQGGSALTVTLPAEWVKSKSLQAGDSVTLTERAGDLTITTSETQEQPRTFRINIDRMGRSLVNRYLDEFYCQGADKIIIEHTKNLLPSLRTGEKDKVTEFINQMMERFMGMEIVSQTEGRIVIQSLLRPESAENSELVKQKVFNMLKELISEFNRSMKGGFNSFNKTLPGRYNNLKRFTNYYCRQLRLSDQDPVAVMNEISLIRAIEKAAGKLRRTGDKVSEMKKIDRGFMKLTEDILTTGMDLVKIAFEKGIIVDEIEKTTEKRYKVMHELEKGKHTPEEYRALLECKLFLDLINDAMDVYVARNAKDRQVTPAKDGSGPR